MKNYRKYKLLIILAALAMMLGAITSCNPQRKIHKAKSVLNEYPDEAAKYCAEKFPVKDTTIVKDSVRFDTLYVPNENDPIVTVETIRDTVYKTVRMPGTTYFVTKTVTKDSLVIRRDVAKETALQAQVDNLIVVNKDYVAKVGKFKKRSDFWMWVAIALGATWVIKIVLSIWGGKFNIGSFLKK